MAWWVADESLMNFAVELPAAPFGGSGDVVVGVETDRAQLCAALSLDESAYDEDVEDALDSRDGLVPDAPTLVSEAQLRVLAYLQEEGSALHQAILESVRQHLVEFGREGPPEYLLRSLWVPKDQPGDAPRWIAVVEPDDTARFRVWEFEGEARVDRHRTWQQMCFSMHPLR